MQRFYPRGAGLALASWAGGNCWGCEGLCHRLSVCPVRALTVADVDGVFPPGANGEVVKYGGGPLTGAQLGKGSVLLGGSFLEYANGSHATVGGAPLSAL